MDRLLSNRLLVQEKLKEDIYREYRNGARRILVEAKTGLGKTHVAAVLSMNSVTKGNRVLFVTPRRRLTDQASAVFSNYSESPASYLMAGRPYDHSAMIHVACDRTLNLRMQRAKKSYSSDNLREFLSGTSLPEFNVIMVDECHIGDASPLMEAYPDAVFIGFSATPAKGDGTGLGDQYETKVLGPTTRELIGLGLLLPVRPFNTNIQIPEGDDPVLLGNVVEHWKKFGEDRQTVLYAKSLKHSQYLVERFLEAGITAEHIDYRVSDEPGDDGKSERDRIYERLMSGTTKVLCNFKLVRFGIDIPPVGCVVLANPSNNMVLRLTDFLQEVGRGRRPYGNQKDMLLFDHTRTVEEYGHPDEEFEFPLHTTSKETVDRLKKKVKEKEKPQIKKLECFTCGHKYEPAPACPNCGTAATFAREEYVEEVDIELSEFGQESPKEQKLLKNQWTKDKARRFCSEVLGYYVGKPTRNAPARIFYIQKDRGIPEGARLGWDDVWKLEPAPCSAETRAFIDNQRKRYFLMKNYVNKKKVA